MERDYTDVRHRAEIGLGSTGAVAPARDSPQNPNFCCVIARGSLASLLLVIVIILTLLTTLVGGRPGSSCALTLSQLSLSCENGSRKHRL
jgi:hypothetical protein